MALLHIAEFADWARLPGGKGFLVKGPPIAKQSIAIAGASTPAAAFNVKTRVVRLQCDAICRVRVNEAGSADATDMRFAAEQTEYFGVDPGGALAVITST